jgi:hypothetical protein
MEEVIEKVRTLSEANKADQSTIRRLVERVGGRNSEAIALLRPLICEGVPKYDEQCVALNFHGNDGCYVWYNRQAEVCEYIDVATPDGSSPSAPMLSALSGTLSLRTQGTPRSTATDRFPDRQ